MIYISFFFFQAEDGIRDRNVTGVQTCALPIYALAPPRRSTIDDRCPRGSEVHEPYSAAVRPQHDRAGRESEQPQDSRNTTGDHTRAPFRLSREIRNRPAANNAQPARSSTRPGGAQTRTRAG